MQRRRWIALVGHTHDVLYASCDAQFFYIVSLADDPRTRISHPTVGSTPEDVFINCAQICFCCQSDAAMSDQIRGMHAMLSSEAIVIKQRCWPAISSAALAALAVWLPRWARWTVASAGRLLHPIVCRLAQSICQPPAARTRRFMPVATDAVRHPRVQTRLAAVPSSSTDRPLRSSAPIPVQAGFYTTAPTNSEFVQRDAQRCASLRSM